MKKIFTILFTLVAFLGYSQSTTLVISQAYGAGGNAGAVYTADYVELHNISSSAISLNGLSVQYGSATTTTAWTGIAVLPTVSIPAGGYYLIQMSAAGANGAALPTPDFTANPAISMAAANGKVALVTGVDPITSCSAATVIDVLGYGTANCAEGTSTAPLTATTAAIRNNNGCADTDDNSVDFTVDTPTPKNSSSAAVSCSSTPTPTITASSLIDFGSVTVGSNSTSQTLTISGSNLTGAPGNITVTAPTGFQVSLDGTTWTTSLTVPYTTATLASTSIFVRFSPATEGVITGDITIDGGGLSSAVTVPVSGTGGTTPQNPAITANTLTDFGTITVGSNSTSQTLTISGANLTGAPGNITITAPTGFQVSMDGTTWTSSVTVPYASATLASTNIFVRFSPIAQGAATGNINISGGGLTTAVTVAVSGNGGTTTPVTSGLVISQAYGAGGNAGAPLNADFVELKNNTTGALSLSGLSIQYGSATSTGAWTSVSALPAVSIPAGGYYLIQMSVVGANGAALPTPDFTATPPISMATANGKVALVSGVTAITSCTQSTIIDLLGYGTANCGETTPSAALSVTGAAMRINNGCTDTNDNSADFTVETPAPRNSASAPVSCSATPTPAITASTLVDFGNVLVGSSSASQTLTISGTNLTGAPGNITITVPTGFQVSLDGTTWATSVSIPYTSGTLASTGIFVRFTPTAAGTYTALGEISGGGITTPIDVALSGTGATTPSDPAITANTLTDFGTVTIGSNSTSQTLTISGSNLTGAPGNITVTAPIGFEISLDGTTWSTSLTVPYTSETLASTNISVRFSPTAAGSASGNITISGGGVTPDVTVSVSGNGGTTTPVTGGLVISQLYGSGGNVGAPLNADYVELKNNTTSAISLAGLSIQYGSATSTTPWSGISALPAASIPAGGFYLIQMSATGTNGAALPTPDYVANPPISMAGANGKVAIVNGTTPISTCTETTIIDLVGYGTANCSETAATAPLTVTGAGMRLNNGCTDTNNNSADFTVETPAPRNSATAPVVCSSGPTATITHSALTDFGSVSVGSNSTSQTLTISGANLTGAPGNITVTAPAGFQVSLDGTTWTTSVTVPYTTGTLASTGVFVRFTPTAVGAASGNITIVGGGGSSSVAVTGTGGSAPVESKLLISQLFGGGGNTGAPFNADYVELHNGTNSPVSLAGKSVQYGSSTGSTWSGIAILPAVTIPVGGYYLVQMSDVGAIGIALPTPDYIANPAIGMAGANGKVALVNGTTALTSCTATNILDLVGYGTANCSETAPTPALSNTTAGFRKQNGCIDTDNNLADFTISAPAPRNSASPINSCGGPIPTLSATPLVTFGGVLVGENSASQTLNLSGTLLTGAPGNITINAPAGFQVSLDGTTWTSSVTVPYTSATLASTPIFVRFTPTAIGAASGNITITGGGANLTVAVSGNGTTPPADVTASALEEFGTVCVNEVGGPNSFTLTGTGLNVTPVVVGPLNGFSFSTTAAGTYTSVLSIPQAGGTLSQQVFVKFTPLAGTSYSGDIPVTGGGIPGTLNVAASGSGNPTGGSVVTGDVSNITANSAVAAGLIDQAGCSPATEYGISYSGIQNFPAGAGRNVQATNIDAAGNFSTQLTGLVQNSIYYYKSYVVNSGITTYGEEKTFTTKPIGNGLIVYSNPITRGNTMHFSISDLQPGHYSVRFYNMLGQVVFQRDIILQVNYIDDFFVVPTTIPKGVYRFQVINQVYKADKTILVL